MMTTEHPAPERLAGNTTDVQRSRPESDRVGDASSRLSCLTTSGTTPSQDIGDDLRVTAPFGYAKPRSDLGFLFAPPTGIEPATFGTGTRASCFEFVRVGRR
jgi:hypothetical protein